MILNMRTEWSTLKSKELPMRYVEAQGNYYIYCNSETAEYCCVIPADGDDAVDFELNFKPTSTGV